MISIPHHKIHHVLPGAVLYLYLITNTSCVARSSAVISIPHHKYIMCCQEQCYDIYTSSQIHHVLSGAVLSYLYLITNTSCVARSSAMVSIPHHKIHHVLPGPVL